MISLEHRKVLLKTELGLYEFKRGKKIGKGLYGTVYEASLYSGRYGEIPLILKTTRVKERDYRVKCIRLCDPKVKIDTMAEIKTLTKINNIVQDYLKFPTDSNAPNFPISIRLTHDDKKTLIIQERLYDTFENFQKEYDNKYEFNSGLIQILFALRALKHNEILHNDLHTQNIMYTETSDEFISYSLDGMILKVPTHGKLFTIIDFSYGIVSSEYPKDTMIHSVILKMVNNEKDYKQFLYQITIGDIVYYLTALGEFTVSAVKRTLRDYINSEHDIRILSKLNKKYFSIKKAEFVRFLNEPDDDVSILKWKHRDQYFLLFDLVISIYITKYSKKEIRQLLKIYLSGVSLAMCIKKLSKDLY